jgi:hypothetical protein
MEGQGGVLTLRLSHLLLNTGQRLAHKSHPSSGLTHSLIFSVMFTILVVFLRAPTTHKNEVGFRNFHVEMLEIGDIRAV